MQDDMRRDAPLASQRELDLRTQSLVELRRIILEWVYEESVKAGWGKDDAKNAGGKIFTFG